MSKGKSYSFFGTLGDIIDIINDLPFEPDIEFLKDWIEFVIEAALGRTKSREFFHKLTKLRIRFDPAEKGKPGFEGQNHYHIYNPNMTGKKDRYLDKNGNPVPKGSDASHILPKRRR
ncbi:MAG: hypothetical protein IJ563_06075 [Selenomonadaceae bacterium]|nr:hypothetical protein [Selenomonadaceae bacterium]MBR1858446.1 hypothetical protein [Selenomonadaceae bacterium]